MLAHNAATVTVDVNVVDCGERYFSWRSTVAVAMMRDRHGRGCRTAWRLSMSRATAAALMVTSRQHQPLSSASPHTVVTLRRFLTSSSHSQVRAGHAVWVVRGRITSTFTRRQRLRLLLRHGGVTWLMLFVCLSVCHSVCEQDYWKK